MALTPEEQAAFLPNDGALTAQARHYLAVLFAHLREIKGACAGVGGIDQSLNQAAGGVANRT